MPVKPIEIVQVICEAQSMVHVDVCEVFHVLFLLLHLLLVEFLHDVRIFCVHEDLAALKPDALGWLLLEVDFQ